MTPEAQRIAIAEACGWRKNHGGLWWKDGAYDNEDGLPPDYLSDLNAMHNAEKTLSEDDLIRQGSALFESCGDWLSAVHATAAQRAEAFLKTLNLWTDEPQNSKMNP